mgnify:CR=1 FL=1
MSFPKPEPHELAELPATATPTLPPPIIHCRDCRHWNRTWPQANHAQCLQANKYASGGSGLFTTDLQTCSQAEAKL